MRVPLRIADGEIQADANAEKASANLWQLLRTQPGDSSSGWDHKAHPPRPDALSAPDAHVSGVFVQFNTNDQQGYGSIRFTNTVVGDRGSLAARSCGDFLPIARSLPSASVTVPEAGEGIP